MEYTLTMRANETKNETEAKEETTMNNDSDMVLVQEARTAERLLVHANGTPMSTSAMTYNEATETMKKSGLGFILEDNGQVFIVHTK